MSQQYIPLLTLTLQATGVLVANRFVTPAVAQATSSAVVIGVALTGAASGDRVPVVSDGTVTVETGGAIAAGSTLMADASGRAVTWSGGAKVGFALEAATAAGQFIEVLLLDNA